MHMVLASASPRRSELLRQIGMDFEVVVSETDETIEEGLKPWEVVEILSARKARAVWTDLPKRSMVIGADTVVSCDGVILGKPGTKERAKEMLELLRDRQHEVYTGVTILSADGREKTFHETTKVTFTPMSDQEIFDYIETNDPMDKAGAYGIQGLCARYIRSIEGDYQNVVGLPVGRLYQELAKMSRETATKKAVIFDLDGTLSDSICSMQYCGNTCLEELGFSPFEADDYRYFVGDGAENLVKRILLRSGDENLENFDRAFQRYKELFAEHCMDGVKPYDDMAELLADLKVRGLSLAVLSNKPHEETVQVVENLFGKGVFDVIQGQEEGVPLKPSPQGALRIMEQMGYIRGEAVLPESVVYLGDTGTDMKTGRSAGAYTVGALWGFRTRKELEEHGADVLVKEPMELLKLIR